VGCPLADGFRAIEAWLRREALRLRRSQPLSAVGLIQAACIGGTGLPAWSSQDPHDTGRGLGDADARVVRGRKGFYVGYESLFLVDIEGFPLGHVKAPANVNVKMNLKLRSPTYLSMRPQSAQQFIPYHCLIYASIDSQTLSEISFKKR
jgi:hypothetical protein